MDIKDYAYYCYMDDCEQEEIFNIVYNNINYNFINKLNMKFNSIGSLLDTIIRYSGIKKAAVNKEVYNKLLEELTKELDM